MWLLKPFLVLLFVLFIQRKCDIGIASFIIWEEPSTGGGDHDVLLSIRFVDARWSRSDKGQSVFPEYLAVIDIECSYLVVVSA